MEHVSNPWLRSWQPTAADSNGALRARLVRRIWAIKGRHGPGIPVWARHPTRTNKCKIPIFIVGVDAVKDAVFARLRLPQSGPGVIHFPRHLGANYFRHLTAECVVTRFERGRLIRYWLPNGDGKPRHLRLSPRRPARAHQDGIQAEREGGGVASPPTRTDAGG
ncbi:terminase gpA endonuclease subunit [Salibaculum halophilum]|uniref:terminase gpA endonuclease subunit n=1 Tax=Salibaculum halophilum TaxID=1914408 RepID=UPI001FE49A33|nr:terminase gpA endonuclease subunit [Salibaculum halophilum]